MVIEAIREKIKMFPFFFFIKLNSSMRIARPEQRHGYRHRRSPDRAQRMGWSRIKDPVVLQSRHCTIAKDKEVQSLKTK